VWLDKVPMLTPPLYQCAACGLAVAITPEGTPIRGCKHDTAAILANAVASMQGAGGLSVGQRPEKR